jgi:hypothetical protein
LHGPLLFLMKISTQKFPEDRVRARTKPEINRKIDASLDHRLRFYAGEGRAQITSRLAELDHEWDLERVLEANAAAAALLGLTLGLTRSRRWLALPMLVAGFLLNHAIQGWCPPVPILRRLGIRTRLEIERERYALKVLRGDFQHLGESAANVEPLIQAAH